MTRIVFGTTSLGLAYGLPSGEGAPPALLDEHTVQALIGEAYARGVRVFDTAPGYGVAEERLGRFLPADAVLWTKVDRRGVTGDELPDFARSSLAESRQRLRRRRVACVQWHNFQQAWLQEPGFMRAVAELKADTQVDAVGATTYGVTDARAALESGLFSLIQIEWNLLNQGVLENLAAEARARGIRVAARSVLLQGALTSAGRRLPNQPTLHAGVTAARDLALRVGGLTELAYRAAFSQSSLDHILIGFRSKSELDEALKFEERGPLSLEIAKAVAQLDLGGDRATDPRSW